MATHTIAAGERNAADKTLTADTVDTVTISRRVDELEVYTDGAASIWFTVDGTTPTVGGKAMYHLPAQVTSRTVPVSKRASSTTVKLISAGTPTYTVAVD